MDRDGFLRGHDAPAGRRNAAVELFILAVQTLNPAAHPLSGLFDDAELQRDCDYRETLRLLDSGLAGDHVLITRGDHASAQGGTNCLRVIRVGDSIC
jgi:hypothetical protein